MFSSPNPCQYALQAPQFLRPLKHSSHVYEWQGAGPVISQLLGEGANKVSRAGVGMPEANETMAANIMRLRAESGTPASASGRTRGAAEARAGRPGLVRRDREDCCLLVPAAHRESCYARRAPRILLCPPRTDDF